MIHRGSEPTSAEGLIRQLLNGPAAMWPAVIAGQPELLVGSFGELDGQLRSLIAARPASTTGAPDEETELLDWLRGFLWHCRDAGVDAAGRFHQAQLDGTPEFEEVAALADQAGAAEAEHDQTGHLEPLKAAIAACDRLWRHPFVATVAPRHEWSAMGTELGRLLVRRYHATGTRADLDAGIDQLRAAANALSPGAPGRSRSETLLATALRDRAVRFAQPADLHAAGDAFEVAVEEALHPAERSELLLELGRVRYVAYYRGGGEGTLDRAIDTLQQAWPDFPQGSPAWRERAAALADLLQDRYQALGWDADLNRAIALSEAVLAATPSDAPDRHVSLAALARNLVTRTNDRGDLNDLDRAIHLFEEAVAAVPQETVEAGALLGNLASTRALRHVHTGALDDLDRAIQVLIAAVDQLPDWSTIRPTLRGNLAYMFRVRSLRSGRREDLDRAIAEAETALSEAGSEVPTRPGLLHGLALILRDRYFLTGRPSDLHAAVAHLEEALAALQDCGTDWPSCASQLAAVLAERYQALGQASSDLDRAVHLAELALDRAAPGVTERAGYENTLAGIFRLRFLRSGDPDDLQRSIGAARSSCTLAGDLMPDVAVVASRDWGAWALQRAAWDEAAEAYGYGLTAIRRLVRDQLLRSHKEDWLRQAQGVAVRAGYAQARIGDLVGAARTLEEGRAITLSEALERDRADVEELADLGHAELANRYRNAVTRWVTHSAGDSRAPGGAWPAVAAPAAPEDRLEVLRDIQHELDATVTAIRDIPGYEGFLDPPRWEDLRAAASIPVVYLAATEGGGLALVLGAGPHGEDEPRACWLPGLTDAAVAEQTKSFLAAYQARTTDRPAWERTLDTVTRWSWQSVMHSLLPMLAEAGATAAALITTGQLGLLPLHAAWTPDPSTPTGRRYALDQLDWSYAPNARTLVWSRALADRARADELLAVQDPQPVTAAALPLAGLEIDAARHHFPVARVLRHGQATQPIVLAELARASVVHLACHGISRPAAPLDSAFIMAGNHSLSVRDLLGQRLGQPPSAGLRLAVASACETAAIGTELPDEVVSLSSAFLQAGVAGVIATLWEVADLGTAMLMARFYEVWRVNGSPPARALRAAQAWLRDTTNSEKATYFQTVPSDCFPVSVGQRLWEALILEPPDERSYDHPAWWAAFMHIGS
jgi:CHAT domain-containing protein